MEEVEKLQEAQRKANGAVEYPVVEKKPEITFEDFEKNPDSGWRSAKV